MNTLSYKTQSAKKETVERKWYVVDAEGEVVGRLGTQIAHILRGKHRPDFTPHVDCGDYVIVINADKIRFTGKKFNDKTYLSYSLYPGGQKSRTPRDYFKRGQHERVLESAVRGMLPKTTLGRAMFKKMFIYTGSEHPHQAQKPEVLDIKK